MCQYVCACISADGEAGEGEDASLCCLRTVGLQVCQFLQAADL